MNFYPKSEENGIPYPIGREGSIEQMFTQLHSEGLKSFPYLTERNELKNQEGLRLLIHNNTILNFNQVTLPPIWKTE